MLKILRKKFPQNSYNTSDNYAFVFLAPPFFVLQFTDHLRLFPAVLIHIQTFLNLLNYMDFKHDIQLTQNRAHSLDQDISYSLSHCVSSVIYQALSLWDNKRIILFYSNLLSMCIEC